MYFFRSSLIHVPSVMDFQLLLLFSFFNFFETATSTKPPSWHENYLDNISTQDALTSDLNASEKVEKKIINVIEKYVSNCNASRRIDLSVEGFRFSKNSVSVDLGWAIVIFYNIRVSEPSLKSCNRKSYSTSIRCDSTEIVKIEVKLLKDLEIYADLKVTQITNSPSECQTSLSDILDTGSITITLKNNTILKQIHPRADDANNCPSKLFYTKSVVSLEIATKFQTSIYSKLQEFLDKIQSPLTQFLIGNLDAELTRNGISVVDSCSRLIDGDENSKKVGFFFTNDRDLHNLHVIPNSKLEMWKGISLSAGPIIIDGLSSFSEAEFTVLENEIARPDVDGFYYRTTPRYDDPETKEITLKITTNHLNGKVDWSYDSNQRSVAFTLAFIQFEVKKSITFQYTRNDYGRHNYYVRANQSRITLNLKVGDAQIKRTKSGLCGNESELENFVLSQYLKTVIADSLKNSLLKKIQNERRMFVVCH